MGSNRSELPVWKVFLAAARQARARAAEPDACALYRKTFELIGEAGDEQPQEAACALLHIADYFRETNDLELCVSACERALERFRRLNGSGPLWSVLTVARLAELHEQKGDVERAEQDWKQVRLMLSQQLEKLIDGSEPS